MNDDICRSVPLKTVSIYNHSRSDASLNDEMKKIATSSYKGATAPLHSDININSQKANCTSNDAMQRSERSLA